MSRPDTLAAILDTLIPPDAERGRPGAGALGIGEALAAAMPGMLDGLLEACESAAGGEGFAALEASAREAILREAEPQDALRGLVFQTFLHYYEHPEVQRALRFEARPPFPEGYALEPGDFGLLAPVRERSALYRKP